SGAVIDLVVGADQGGHRGHGDVSGRAGRGVDGVIGRVSAADRNAADAHRFGRAYVRVGEAGAGVAGGETVAGHPIICERDVGAGGAVINLIHPSSRNAQGASRNVGGGAGGRVGGVVGRISAAESDAADGDGFSRADILVSETGGGVGGR